MEDFDDLDSIAIPVLVSFFHGDPVDEAVYNGISSLDAIVLLDRLNGVPDSLPPGYLPGGDYSLRRFLYLVKKMGHSQNMAD